MPEGKKISFEAGEYPELEGLEPGSKIKFEGMGTLEEGGLMIDSIEMSAEGMADRELKSLTKQSAPMGGQSKSLADNF